MSQVQRQSGGRISSSLGDLSLFLLSPSTDWMRPTHIMEGSMLYSKFIDLNVIMSKKYLHSNI